MTVRRTRIFVDLAPPIEYASRLPQRELSAQLRQVWLQSAHFTCTQLATGFLVQINRAATPSFTLDELTKDVELQAASLAAAGRHVDQRLLRAGSARKLAAGFLAYAAPHGLVQRTGKYTWVLTIRDLAIKVHPSDVGYRQAPLAYAWNELQEMLSFNYVSVM